MSWFSVASNTSALSNFLITLMVTAWTLPTVSAQTTTQITSGACSAAISNVTGNVTINCPAANKDIIDDLKHRLDEIAVAQKSGADQSYREELFRRLEFYTTRSNSLRRSISRSMSLRERQEKAIERQKASMKSVQGDLDSGVGNSREREEAERQLASAKSALEEAERSMRENQRAVEWGTKTVAGDESVIAIVQELLSKK